MSSSRGRSPLMSRLFTLDISMQIPACDVSCLETRGLDSSGLKNPEEEASAALSWVSSKDSGSLLSRLNHDGLVCCKRSGSEVSIGGCNADRSVSEVWD